MLLDVSLQRASVLKKNRTPHFGKGGWEGFFHITVHTLLLELAGSREYGERIDPIRLMQPEDAIEISRGVYKSHGYTFFDDSIYYPEQIIKLNETGKMISAVAVTKDNQFMGHGALVYPYLGAKIAEFNFFFVNNPFSRKINPLSKPSSILPKDAPKS